ncbi:MAG: alkene reductase [Hyphomonadaceae bacterium]|nr:alkene reductase [Hyphomonadaceae bacterium]
MADEQDILFTPVRMGRIVLQNRIAMAPMTRHRAGVDFVPQEISATYYAQRASAALIITEASQVSRTGAGYPRTPGVYNDVQVEGWRRIVDAVHQRGARILLQLWHAGRISHAANQPDGVLPVAPSALRPEGEIITASGMRAYPTPRALETHEIAGVVEEFRHGAQMALKAGFDGVELHAANGYLLDQFLRDGANQRTDEYGGSIENRQRMLLMTIEAVAQVWGAERVGVHISPLVNVHGIWDSNPAATFSALAERLRPMGLAYLHVFERNISVSHKSEPMDFAPIRKAYGGFYIANGGYDADRARAAIACGHADLVSFGTMFISNPDLPARMRLGAPLAAADTATYYQGEERGYTDYPFLDGGK